MLPCPPHGRGFFMSPSRSALTLCARASPRSCRSTSTTQALAHVPVEFFCAPSPAFFIPAFAVIVDLWKRNLFRVILECSTVTIDDELDEQRIRISKGLIELLEEEREKLLKAVTSRRGWAWCPSKLRPATAPFLAKYRNAVTATCASCSCKQPGWCLSNQRAGNAMGSDPGLKLPRSDCTVTSLQSRSLTN